VKRSSNASDAFEGFEGSAEVTHIDSYTAGPYTDGVQLVTTIWPEAAVGYQVLRNSIRS